MKIFSSNRPIATFLLCLIFSTAFAQRGYRPRPHAEPHNKDVTETKDLFGKTIYSSPSKKESKRTEEYKEETHEYSKKLAIHHNSANNLELIISTLQEKRENLDNYKIISLVENDIATNTKLKEEFTGKVLHFDYSSANRLKNILLQNRMSTIHLIGHLEDDNFVTKVKNVEVFKISIDEIEEFQLKFGMEIYYDGCESGLNGAGTGFLTPINSVDVLNNIKKAHSGGAKIFANFLEELAGDYSIVVGVTTIKGMLATQIKIINEQKVQIVGLRRTKVIWRRRDSDTIPFNNVLGKDMNSRRSNGVPEESPMPRVIATIGLIFLLLFGSIYLYKKKSNKVI